MTIERPRPTWERASLYIYSLEEHPKLGPRFKPLFEAHQAGRLRFAITTITIAEVLAGPLRAGDDALAQRYRAIFEAWQLVALDVDIAESAARLRARWDSNWQMPSRRRAH